MQAVKSYPCFLTPTQLNPDYPLFIFLPGMDGTGQLLRSQTQGLESAFDVRSLAIPPDNLTDWDELSEIVLTLIRKELEKHPSRPVYLSGESFGGCLAIKVALREPELFERIILSNPATCFKQRPWLQWGSPLFRWLPDHVYQASTLAFLPFLSALGRTAPHDCRALLKAMQSVPAKTASWRISMLSEFDIDERQLRHLSQPFLIIAGAADQLLPSVMEAQRLVNYLPNAKMVVLPQSGHACLLEKDINLFQIMKDNSFLGISLLNQEAEPVFTPTPE
ncbi:MAG: alpha/beta fold hydrolase [Coleofasciculaceae cyanobacterium]